MEVGIGEDWSVYVGVSVAGRGGGADRCMWLSVGWPDQCKSVCYWGRSGGGGGLISVCSCIGGI